MLGEFEKERDALSGDIKNLKLQARELAGKVESLEDEADGARRQYDKLLDAGERQEAFKSLDRIKPLREKAEAARAELSSLTGQITQLRERQSKLRLKASELRQEAEDKLKFAQTQEREATLFCSMVQGLWEGIHRAEQELKRCINVSSKPAAEKPMRGQYPSDILLSRQMASKAP